MLLFGLIDSLEDKDVVKIVGILVGGTVAIVNTIVGAWIIVIQIKTRRELQNNIQETQRVVTNVATLQDTQDATADRVKSELERANKLAAQKVEQEAAKVKAAVITTQTAQDKKLDTVLKQNEVIHTLVNGKMTIQLKINAELLRKIYELTGKQEDKEAAEMAERVYNTYNATQVVVETALRT